MSDYNFYFTSSNSEEEQDVEPEKEDQEPPKKILGTYCWICMLTIVELSQILMCKKKFSFMYLQLNDRIIICPSPFECPSLIYYLPERWSKNLVPGQEIRENTVIVFKV